MDISSADEALLNGFPSLAIHQYLKLLETPDLHANEIVHVRTQLVKCYLDLSLWENAKKQLELLNREKSANLDLYRALFQFRQKNIYLANTYLGKINLNELDSTKLTWYYMLKGLIADVRKNREEANIHFETAKKFAVNDDQRSRVGVAILQSEFYHEEATEAMAQDLKNQLSNFKGQSTEHEFVRQYAIVLDSLGRKEEAIKAIEDFLSNSSNSSGRLRDQFLLLTTLIAGPQSPRGQLSLKSLISEGNDIDYIRMAFSILVSNANNPEKINQLEAFLTQVASNPKHLLIEKIIFSQALIAEQNKQLDKAEQIASKFLESYPGSPLIEKIFILLANIAFKKDPPQYRTMASWFNRLNEVTNDTEKKREIRFWIADCYYLDKDYTNAASAYKLLYQESKNSNRDIALFQFINSKIREGQIEEASTFLSAISFDELATETRWRAEWNIILAIKEKNGIEDAMKRVQNLKSEINSIPRQLALRFMWFETQLTFQDSKNEEIINLADDILNIIPEQSDGSQIDQAILDSIQSQTLLAKGRSLLKLEREEDALTTFKLLRNKFPKEESSAISMLIEASYYTSKNLNVEAQSRLIQLVDNFPESPSAPRALLEAAINAEKRGLNTSYEEAITILNNLLEKYPKSDLVFFARLKQGHLLRRLNQFGASQKIYENLIQDYKNDPRVYQVELARVDALNAMANKNTKLYNDVISHLENMAEKYQNNSIETEILYKLGLAYQKNNQNDKAEATLWRNIEKNAINSKMNNNSGFWVSRSILELSDILTAQKAIEESQKALQWILDYNLPGKALAKSKLDRLNNL